MKESEGNPDQGQLERDNTRLETIKQLGLKQELLEQVFVPASAEKSSQERIMGELGAESDLSGSLTVDEFLKLRSRGDRLTAEEQVSLKVGQLTTARYLCELYDFMGGASTGGASTVFSEKGTQWLKKVIAGKSRRMASSNIRVIADAIADADGASEYNVSVEVTGVQVGAVKQRHEEVRKLLNVLLGEGMQAGALPKASASWMISDVKCGRSSNGGISDRATATCDEYVDTVQLMFRVVVHPSALSRLPDLDAEGSIRDILTYLYCDKVHHKPPTDEVVADSEASVGSSAFAVGAFPLAIDIQFLYLMARIEAEYQGKSIVRFPGLEPQKGSDREMYFKEALAALKVMRELNARIGADVDSTWQAAAQAAASILLNEESVHVTILGDRVTTTHALRDDTSEMKRVYEGEGNGSMRRLRVAMEPVLVAYRAYCYRLSLRALKAEQKWAKEHWDGWSGKTLGGFRPFIQDMLGIIEKDKTHISCGGMRRTITMLKERRSALMRRVDSAREQSDIESSVLEILKEEGVDCGDAPAVHKKFMDVRNSVFYYSKMAEAAEEVMLNLIANVPAGKLLRDSKGWENAVVGNVEESMGKWWGALNQWGAIYEKLTDDVVGAAIPQSHHAQWKVAFEDAKVKAVQRAAGGQGLLSENPNALYGAAVLSETDDLASPPGTSPPQGGPQVQ